MIARTHAGAAGTVLVIDGDLGVTRETRSALSPDCRVLQAFSGEEGLRMCEAEIPEVVIVDLAVPGLSGIGLVARLHGRPHARRRARGAAGARSST